MTNKFRGGNGGWRTKGLFVDVMQWGTNLESYGDKAKDGIYYLSEKSDESIDRPILKDLFLSFRDITGTKLANKYLGGWDHLKALLECKWFKVEWDLWQDELFNTMKMERLEKIMEIAESDSPQAFQASKYIANKEYESTSSKRGRPSKEEISGELKNQVRKLTDLESDYERIMGSSLTLIQGGKK